MKQRKPTAREEAADLPCVIIDRDEHGNDYVYCDPGVHVFSRSTHVLEDPLYRYTPPPIPEGWLDRPAGHFWDGLEAQTKVLTEPLNIIKFEPKKQE